MVVAMGTIDFASRRSERVAHAYIGESFYILDIVN
jgi:hypothetical protein